MTAAQIAALAAAELAGRSVDEQVAFLNDLRQALQKLSPQTEPADTVVWVKADQIRANSWNPNKTASVEQELLAISIQLDGYTMPVVCYRLADGTYEVVDGFHRRRVCLEHDEIRERTHGYLPVTVIDKPESERVGSTVRHNRARGTHQIRSMSDIVVGLAKEGWSDEKIGERLGMDRDEVLRLKQVSGLKEAFANHEFSKSWEEFESKYYPPDLKRKTVAQRRAEKK